MYLAHLVFEILMRSDPERARPREARVTGLDLGNQVRGNGSDDTHQNRDIALRRYRSWELEGVRDRALTRDVVQLLGSITDGDTKHRENLYERRLNIEDSIKDLQQKSFQWLRGIPERVSELEASLKTTLKEIEEHEQASKGDALLVRQITAIRDKFANREFTLHDDTPPLLLLAAIKKEDADRVLRVDGLAYLVENHSKDSQPCFKHAADSMHLTRYTRWGYYQLTEVVPGLLMAEKVESNGMFVPPDKSFLAYIPATKEAVLALQEAIYKARDAKLFSYSQTPEKGSKMIVPSKDHF